MLAFSGLALAAPAAELEPRGSGGTRHVVAAIGDSLTDPRSGGGKYLRALSRLCPESRFDAYGVGGQSTQHMRWRIKSDLFGPSLPWMKKPERYTDAIVLAGVNDVSGLSLVDPRIGRIKTNLSFLYQVAKTGGLRVVAVTIPPWGRMRGGIDRRGEATETLNDWILERPKDKSVDVAVDVRPALTCGDSNMLCAKYRRYPDDFIHWNVAGHSVVAEELHRTAFADCR
jgi:hypothetical protein